MTIPPELEAKILQKHKAEKWPVGTISNQLEVHHEAVERVIREDGLPKPHFIRTSKLEPYIPFVIEQWEKYPKLPASKMYRMTCARGYSGSESHFRAYTRKFKPRRAAEAYLRRKTLKGEEGQVDWAHFGKVKIGNAIRKLYAFIIVLSWSRRIYLRFFLGMQMANFLLGHKLAFELFGGIPRRILYDNLKSVVRERIGDAVRFNPVFLRFAGHYAFEPRPVGIARGNEKGRVERAIRYVRSSFWHGCEWSSIEDLNYQAERWAIDVAGKRPCPENNSISVAAAFDVERRFLLPLPNNPFPTLERKELKARKQPYVRFDLNDYSVPHKCVGKQLVLLADEDKVRLLDGEEVVAEHKRSFSKKEQIENPKHIKELVESKRRAKEDTEKNRLAHTVPLSQELLAALAQRGESLKGCIRDFLKLLDEHGAEKLEKAMQEALQSQTPHPNSVRTILEQWRLKEGQPAPIPITLPDDPRIRNIAVRPHPLSSYDTVEEDTEEHEEGESQCH